MQDSKINTETKSVEGSASLWILNRLKNKNDTTLKTYTLKFGPNTIGRALHNDIILENENISKSHCRIWIENNNIPILDEIDSRNGTYVKETKIERLERYKLIDNDIIYLSGATLGVTLQICTTFKVDKKTNTSLVLSDCNVTKKLKRSSDELKSDCIDSTFDNKNQRGFDNSAPIIMPLDVTNEPINLKEIWATEWALKFIEHMNTTESGDSIESCCLSINNSILNVEEKNQDNNDIKIKSNQKNNKIFNNQNLPITCSTSFDILNKDEPSTSIELHQHHNNSEIVVETINQNNEMVNSVDKTSRNQNILNSSNNNINVKLSTINGYLLEAISYICKWDAKWLQKYKISDQMPPLVNAIQKMKSHFDSLQDYLLTLKSLFLYEIWSSIMQSYHLLEKQIPSLESFIYTESASNSPLLRLTVKSLDKEFTSLNKNLSTPLWCLTCILILDQKRDHNVRFPDSGDLLLLITEINKNTKNVFFAYTDGVLNSISHEGMKKKQIILSLLITEKSFNILENTPVQCLSLFYVCAELRLFQSICSVSISPLHNAIAMPSLHKNTNPTFTFISDVMKKNMENLDCNQKKALMIGVRLGLSQSSDICLINGFPGTGKTHVVINIVQSLILAKVLNKKSTKVLLCASSNIAVDELVQRLLFIKEKTPHLKNINLVKVGNKNSEISLDSLVNKKIAEINEDCMLNKLRDKYTNILSKLKNEQQQSSMIDKLLEKEVQKAETYLKQLSTKNVQKLLFQKEIQTEVLTSADVIVSTLNSCLTKSIENLFMPLLVTQNINEHNFICLIDDAEQCIEPLTLLPILFGINRLILVGNDSLVKPIVKNQISKDNDLNISLIRRLNLWLKKSKNVEDNSSNISRITLDRQYRTHSSICSFPSTFFYGRTIKNTTSTFENYPLQRYLLLNHKFIHDNVEDINMNEAVLIQNLIHIIVSNVQNKIIKIALSNENQYKIIKGLIKNNLKNVNYESISVQFVLTSVLYNTECDILILSTASSKIIKDDHLLCTIMTRPRHSLFLCGNFDYLKSHYTWKKLLEDAYQRKVVKYVNENIISNLKDMSNLIKCHKN